MQHSAPPNALTGDGDDVPDELRADVRLVVDAHASLSDEARPEAVKAQHDRGKLTARERIDLLLDPDGRIEYGSLVTPEGEGVLAKVSATGRRKAGELPLEGPITATGFVEGRPVCVVADDFTMLGGTAHALGGMKMVRMAELALERGVPLIFMLDGGGHRVHNMDTRMFAAGGRHGPFRHTALLSGWVPQVAAVMGPAYAGPAMATAMADFVPIVSGTGFVGMAGPKLVKAGTGEEISNEDLGGSAVQARAGAVDLECESDAVCLETIKTFLSYLPTNAAERPPVVASDDPIERQCPDLRDIVPVERRRAYDVRVVMREISDDRMIFEHRTGFAKNLVTAFGRVGGESVGFLGNQSGVFAGTLDAAACIKATRFLSMCDAFGVPVVSLIDTPGFLVGSKAERENTVRHMGRMLMVLAHVTVPLITIVLRKGYGGGYVAMGGGRSYPTDATWVWPTAEISAMGVEGAVDIAFHHDYESAENPQARRQEIIEDFYRQITPLNAAAGFGVDDVIDPAETRSRIGAVLRVSKGRRQAFLPPKRHSVDPL